jgi:hypothetical protein
MCVGHFNLRPEDVYHQVRDYQALFAEKQAFKELVCFG